MKDTRPIIEHLRRRIADWEQFVPQANAEARDATKRRDDLIAKIEDGKRAIEQLERQK